MKITKILLVALSLMLFSCSEQEDVTVASQSEVKLKSSGLTQQDVDQLTKDCVAFSKSAEFLNMRAKAKEFAQMMNFKVDKAWTSRSDVANWLGSNLSATKFVTVQEGVDMFDNLSAKSNDFLVANDRFFSALPNATGGQIKVILKPIQPELPPVETDSECDAACFQQGIDWVFMELNSYHMSMQASYQAGTGTRQWLQGLAEASLASGMDFAHNLTMSCLEDCDAQ